MKCHHQEFEESGSDESTVLCARLLFSSWLVSLRVLCARLLFSSWLVSPRVLCQKASHTQDIEEWRGLYTSFQVSGLPGGCGRCHARKALWLRDTLWSKVTLLLPFHSWAQKVHSPNLLKRKCISKVVRICIKIIFHLSKLWKAKFSLLGDVIFLVGLEGKFDIDHSQEWKG